jgi:hypothetical protein
MLSKQVLSHAEWEKLDLMVYLLIGRPAEIPCAMSSWHQKLLQPFEFLHVVLMVFVFAYYYVTFPIFIMQF